MFAGARPHVYDVIGGAHHFRIVLHHHDGIAQLAQFVEDADQPAGVAAMQADGRFIEHVAGAHQARAERGGQLNALGFAAGKSGSQPVQRQVFQPHIVQKLEPLANFHQHLVGDGGFFRRELSAPKNW